METNGTQYGCNIQKYFGYNIIYITISLDLIFVCKSVVVILAVCKTISLHTNVNVLMTSLTLTDIIMGLSYLTVGCLKGSFVTLGMPDTNIHVLDSFVLGDWYSAMLISLAHMSLIAIDRYIYLAHPFVYIKLATKRRVCITLSCVWTCGFVYLCIPIIIYNNSIYHEKCILLKPPLEYFLIGSFVYVIINITLLISYLKIASLAFKHKKAAIARRRRFHNSDSAGAVIIKTNLMAAIRSTKYFALMYGVFVLCTIPPIIATGLCALYGLTESIYIPVMLLLPINSILNFVIYLHMNKQFSDAVKKMFCHHQTCFC